MTKTAILAAALALALAACAPPATQPSGEERESATGGDPPPSAGKAAAGGADADDEAGGDATTPKTGGTKTGTEAPAAEAPAAACSTLENTATSVASTANVDPLPEAKGGKLADGVYHLTAKVYHGLAAVPKKEEQQETIEIKGGMMHEIETEDGIDSQSSSSITVKDTALELTETCPIAEPTEAKLFTARGATIVIIDEVKQTAKTFTRK